MNATARSTPGVRSSIILTPSSSASPPPPAKPPSASSIKPCYRIPYVQAVADGVNVGYDIYRIKTEVSEQGTKLEAKYDYQRRDR